MVKLFCLITRIRKSLARKKRRWDDRWIPFQFHMRAPLVSTKSCSLTHGGVKKQVLLSIYVPRTCSVSCISTIRCSLDGRHLRDAPKRSRSRRETPTDCTAVQDEVTVSQDSIRFRLSHRSEMSESSPPRMPFRTPSLSSASARPPRPSSSGPPPTNRIITLSEPTSRDR